MIPEPLISCVDLHYAVGGKPILALLDWSVGQGEHTLLLGPSGCGKTTLLHLLAGLLTPTSGSIRIAGEALSAMESGARDRFRGGHIGLVYQALHLTASLSVRRNLELAAFMAGRKAQDAHIDRLLDALGMRDRQHDRPHQLSFGQKQRVAIARALVNRPALILADEPTSALDDAQCDAVMALLKEQAREHGATLIVATHDMRLKPHFSGILQLEAQA